MNRSRLYTAILLFFLFVVTAMGLNYGGLKAPMRYDSAAKLEGRSSLFGSGAWSSIKVFPQRPLPILSFYLNYVIGGMQPGYFRAVNLAILAATAIVAILLIHIMVTIPGLWDLGSRNEKYAVSVLAGLLFLVHPVQTYVTLYVWQRMAIMACFFYYSSLTAYLAVRLGKIENRTAGYCLCLGLFVCALLSKENAVTLPLAVILADIAFLRDGGLALVKRAAVYLGVSLTAIGAISFLQHPHGDMMLGTGILDTIAAYYRESALTPTDVLLTQCRVLFKYLTLSLVPLPGKILLVSPQVVSHSLWNPPATFVAVLVAAGLISVGIYLLKKRPLSGFGVLFYVVNMIPEALMVPQYAFFGYRAVLPLLGLCFVLADCSAVALDSIRGSKVQRSAHAALLGLGVAGVILMATVTVERARIWSDEVGFWKEAVSQFPPHSDDVETRVEAQVLTNLARALYVEGNNSEALGYYQEALKLRPLDARALASLGATYAKLGNAKEAEASLRKALEICPELAYAHENLGNILMARSRDEGLEHLRKAADLSRHNAGRDHVCPQ